MSNPIPGYNPPLGEGELSGYAVRLPRQLPPESYASWISRVVAVIVDGFITLAVMSVFVVPGLVILVRSAHVYVDANDELDLRVLDEGLFAWGIVLLGFAFLLEFIFVFWNNIYRVSKQGASLGKSALGIQIERQDNGEFLTLGSSFLRYLLYSLLGNACALNYFWPLWDPQHRAWHDMVMQTYVVKR